MADLSQIKRLDSRRIETERMRRRSPFLTMFPASGPHRRELYPKHIEFFSAGAQYKERLFMAANRVGKTVAGAFETTCHLTGCYPDWWKGHRFDHATDAWACRELYLRFQSLGLLHASINPHSSPSVSSSSETVVR